MPKGWKKHTETKAQTTFIGKRGVVAVQTIPRFPNGYRYLVVSSKNLRKNTSFTNKRKAMVHANKLMKKW